MASLKLRIQAHNLKLLEREIRLLMNDKDFLLRSRETYRLAAQVKQELESIRASVKEKLACLT